MSECESGTNHTFLNWKCSCKMPCASLAHVLWSFHWWRASGTTKLPGTDLIKTAFEPALSFCTIVPLLVDDTESDILIGRPGDETDQACVIFAGGSKGLATPAAVLPLDLVRGRFCLVDEVGVEYVELVALDDLGRGVIVVVVGLVVLVPFVAHLHTVEVARLSRLVGASPLRARGGDLFFGCEDLLAFFDAACDLAFVEGHGCLRVVVLLDWCKPGGADGSRAETGRRVVQCDLVCGGSLGGHIA